MRCPRGPTVGSWLLTVGLCSQAKPSLILRGPKLGVPTRRPTQDNAHPDRGRVAQAFVAQKHIQTRTRLPLNMPGTCWVNMFIRGSHNQWPLKAAVIHKWKAIFQQEIARACTSHPEDAILYIASCIYKWGAVILQTAGRDDEDPPPRGVNTTN